MDEFPPDSVFELGGESIPRGSRKKVTLRLARLPNATEVGIETTVIRGARGGPCIWLSAAIHGDELNGVEIIRRVIDRIDESKLRGIVVAVPIVNVFGFLHQSRYLPDRRDLNRSFPGTAKGSMAARLARLFMTEVVHRCSFGIDFHTAARDRDNLPQIRADLEDEPTLQAARAFGAPVLLHSKTRDGSLRAAASRAGVRVLLYEGGEAQRFNEDAIRAGLRGALRVIEHLGMIRLRAPRRPEDPRVVMDSRWIRASRGGLLRLDVDLGEQVEKGCSIGVVAGALGDDATTLRAPFHGTVIGITRNPLVYQGDGILHLARTSTAPGGSSR